MTATRERIVRTADRPDLIPIVAHWIWDAFWRQGGYSRAHVEGVVARSTAETGPQQTFVLLVDEVPVGTASLVEEDLDERPDLTPWLAAVFVAPEARGRGHAGRLVAAVETACRAASTPVLWLYTLNTAAERVYRRAGWEAIEAFEHHGKPAVLMRRMLSGDTAATPVSGAGSAGPPD